MDQETEKLKIRPVEEFVAFLQKIGQTSIDGRPAQASRTAFITAFMRAFHSINENPKVFDDWMAARLLSTEEYAFFEEMYYRGTVKDETEEPVSPTQRRAVVTAVLRAGAAGGVLSRARFAEDSLETAIDRGIRQYVLLGAGLDTFALRRADLLDKIQVIEVDHPATQALKRQRLSAMGHLAPPSLEFIAVDFSQENLPQALSRSSFDFETPAFFSWLGVTYYLERENLFQVLHSLSETAAPHSRVVFDYMDTEAFDPDMATPRVKDLRNKVRLLGEPMKTGLDPRTLEKDLRQAGWKLLQNLAPNDIEKIYFQEGPEGFRAGKHIHLALASLPGR
ncbi:MAG: class I SAM-dependent methyltransferase [Deltaproteobacteria bacterium]|nr:class I SAM-dependent methyltransferase [Deltaproteobacteria bacterium]MBF0527156.1 class I SAM-dependent methyltransferase [Deltaproteobacteria bacterium]